MADEPVICVVEIPKGSRNKYEWDDEIGRIVLDRYLASSVVWPTDYGYVPETLALDGDHLDAMVCVSEPTFSGCAIRSKPIALFKMEDEEGIDDTLLCVPCDDPGWNTMEELDDLPEQLRQEISHFFDIYKDLEPGKEATVHGWRSREEALEEIEAAQRRYREGGDSGGG
jgi:inorganic pyrophosphatase